MGAPPPLTGEDAHDLRLPGTQSHASLPFPANVSHLTRFDCLHSVASTISRELPMRTNSTRNMCNPLCLPHATCTSLTQPVQSMEKKPVPCTRGDEAMQRTVLIQKKAPPRMQGGRCIRKGNLRSAEPYSRARTSSTSAARATRVSSPVPISRRRTLPEASSSPPMTTIYAAPTLSACLNWLFSERPW